MAMETKHAELHASGEMRTSSDERGQHFFTMDPDAGCTITGAAASGASAGVCGEVARRPPASVPTCVVRWSQV
jgi:hypothetical protein